MSTVKISDLPVLSSADAADEFVVVDDSAGVTKKITQGNLNVLVENADDYEEGTWTPTYTSNGTNPSGTYNQQIGYYIRIGNKVFLEGRLGGGATTSIGSGSIRISGLPFQVASLANNVGAGLIPFAVNFNSEHPFGLVPLEGTFDVAILKRASTSALSGTEDLVAGDLGTSTTSNSIIFGLAYTTT